MSSFLERRMQGPSLDQLRLAEAEDLIDEIGMIVGWGDNPDPDDPQEAIDKVVRLLWYWTK